MRGARPISVDRLSSRERERKSENNGIVDKGASSPLGPRLVTVLESKSRQG